MQTSQMQMLQQMQQMQQQMQMLQQMQNPMQMQQMQQMQMQQMHAPAVPQPQVHAHVSAAPDGDSPVRFRVSAAAVPAVVNTPQKSGSSYMEMNALLNQLHLERVSAGARSRWHED